jgi:Flp pilus assembly protein TadG
MTTHRHKRIRGQAIIELSLAAPVLVVLALGATDMGRAFFYRLPVATAASAGARAGAVSSTADIGSVVRSQSSAMPNTAATWGNAYTGGTMAGCTNVTLSSQACGDSGGCVATSSFWTSPPSGQPNPVACFAVRSCTIDTSSAAAHNGQCTKPAGCTAATSGWSTSGTQARPSAGSALLAPPCLAALQVTVAYRFTAMTPLIGNFFNGPGHALYINSTVTVIEQY